MTKADRVNWKLVRIPADLHAKLYKLRKEYDRQAAAGEMPDLPPEFAARGGTPYWYVIARLLDELDADDA